MHDFSPSLPSNSSTATSPSEREKSTDGSPADGGGSRRQMSISGCEVAKIDALNPQDRADRRTLKDRVPHLTRKQVRESDLLTWADPDGRFDLDQDVEAGGYLFFHHRRRMEELLQLTETLTEALEMEPHWRTLGLPLRAPIPPCTDARLVVQEGGNEGWKVYCQFTNRKDAGGRYGSEPRARDGWTAKYLSSRAKDLASEVNDQIWDLGSTARAKEAWTCWHETGRWNGPIADRMREISSHESTRAVRSEGDLYQWPRDVRTEVTRAARCVGREVVAELTGIDGSIIREGP